MTKQEILAIQTLPRRYVADGTMVVIFNECPIVFNGENGLPVIWKPKGSKRWVRMKFIKGSPPTDIQGAHAIGNRVAVFGKNEISEITEAK